MKGFIEMAENLAENLTKKVTLHNYAAVERTLTIGGGL